MENDVDKERVALLLSALRRKRATRDPKFFAAYYLPHFLKFKTPAFHHEIYDLLNEKRLAVAAPRSFAKSTIVQVIRGLQLLLTGTSEDILTISASSDLAKEWIRKLKIELETNQKIIEDFGHMYKWGPEISKKWTEDQLTIDDFDGRIVNQIRSKGRGCQVRGFRPTRIFCDDLEDDESVRSSDQRKKLTHWFKGALMNTITIDQQLIVIGTLLHPLALLKEMVDNKEDFSEWKTKTYKAIKDGRSIWEEKWSTEALEARKAEIGTYAFEAEFQNNPLGSEDVLFRPEWIQVMGKDWWELPEMDITFLIIDPASSTADSADETAMGVFGLSKDMKFYEIETISGKWGIWEMVEQFFKLYDRTNPDSVGIEKVAFQGVIKPILMKEAKKRGYSSIPIKQITVGAFNDSERREAKDKWTRAFKVTHYFENKQVFLKSRKLIDQLVVFPTGDLDDLVDVCIYGLLMIDRFIKKSAVFREPGRDKVKFIGEHEVRDPAHEPPPYEIKPNYDWKTAG